MSRKAKCALYGGLLCLATPTQAALEWRLGGASLLRHCYLITGNRDQIQPLHNMRLIERLQELETFDSDDQETIIKMIDAMIVKRRVEGAVAPIDRQRASG